MGNSQILVYFVRPYDSRLTAFHLLLGRQGYLIDFVKIEKMQITFFVQFTLTIEKLCVSGRL